MRKGIHLIGLVGLTSVALTSTARAEDAPATPVATTTSAAPAHQRKLEVGVAFLPMSLGRFHASYGVDAITSDAMFAPGVSVSASYEVLPGLSIGVAPQRLWKVASKVDPTMSGTPVTDYSEFDLMARLSYGYRVIEGLKLYAEVLPGYSLMTPSFGHASKGFVLAAGGGVAMDMGDRVFVNVGAGYQVGFQHLPAQDGSQETSTRYVRFVLGIGVRF
jgi:opacity protein-like surface antigen